MVAPHTVAPFDLCCVPAKPPFPTPPSNQLASPSPSQNNCLSVHPAIPLALAQTGETEPLQGANQRTLTLHNSMSSNAEFITSLAWTASSFSLDAYQLVSLPGGHDKGVQQVIDSASILQHLVSYFPQTRKAGDAHKTIAAICHGVLGLSEAKGPDGRSVLFDASTTSLPGAMEQGFFWTTRAVLGDCYRTYGAGGESVEVVMRRSLRDSEKQYKNSHSMSPFVVSDETYNYVSGRFPPDAQLLAKKAIEVVRGNLK